MNGNPWKEIELSDYEGHMKLDTVFQLQTLNQMMKEQLTQYPSDAVMILGVAGGNGLEHIGPGQFKAVYGVDINQQYLEECVRRYVNLGEAFRPICGDLTGDVGFLPHADLLIANLLIEYIGYDCFQKVILQVQPHVVSCGIQVNGAQNFVSDSPYSQVFDGLDSILHSVDEESLSVVMRRTGYHQALRKAWQLPNGKQLVRLDYQR